MTNPFAAIASPARASFDWPTAIKDKARQGGMKRITVFGKLVIDVNLPTEGELVSGGNVDGVLSFTAGGAPANVTSCLAAHGQRARFAGWAGNDPLSAWKVEELRSRNIEFQTVSRGQSTVAVIITPTGRPSKMVTSKGEGAIGPQDVRPSWFKSSSVVHFDGYDLLPNSFPEALSRAADLARQAGALVTFDNCAANKIQEFGVEAYVQAVANIRPDIIFANELEAEILSSAKNNFSWNPLVLVHRADKSTLAIEGGRVLEVPVPPAEIIDATGCGDAFAAGTLAGWVNGLNLCGSIEQAHSWAAEVGQVIGAQLDRPVPTQRAARALL